MIHVYMFSAIASSFPETMEEASYILRSFSSTISTALHATKDERGHSSREGSYNNLTSFLSVAAVKGSNNIANKESNNVKTTINTPADIKHIKWGTYNGDILTSSARDVSFLFPEAWTRNIVINKNTIIRYTCPKTETKFKSLTITLADLST